MSESIVKPQLPAGEIYPQLETGLRDNVFEYLQLNNIKKITFVFAHPDDLEGYAGGLFHQLMELGDRLGLNVKLVVATDGANGTKNQLDRNGLITTRQNEQLAGLDYLGMPKEVQQTNVDFFNIVDGTLAEHETEFEEHLQEQFAIVAPDLVITHNLEVMGRSGNLRQGEENDFVQNHPDHRATARVIQKLRQEGGVLAGKQVLQASWSPKDNKLTAGYQAGLKIEALRQHQSQHSQNHQEMDAIEYDLNNYGDQLPRYEFFAELEPAAAEPIKQTLFTAAGAVIENAVFSRLDFNNIKAENPLRIRNAQKSVDISPEGTKEGAIEEINYTELTNLRREIINRARAINADLLIIDEVDDEFLAIIDKVLMYDVSIHLDEEGIEGKPVAVRKLLIPHEKGNVDYAGKKYFYVNFRW
ncbi:MAG: PIG-L family deacetylase [bacterium]